MDYIDQFICGDCCEVISKVPDKIFGACITSPPYALIEENPKQCRGYDEISSKDYPSWTVNWMNALAPKLKDDGSVLIVIRSNIKKGSVSDYVMRTRLAVRDAGWIECEELIWYKADAPPLGSYYRPRRCWENILWFSKTHQPYVDLFACGNKDSKRTGGYKGSNRFKDSDNPLSPNQNDSVQKGTSRITDVFCAMVSEIESGIMHPAMYPATLTDKLILTFSRPGDVIIDPFMGSGTTAISAKTNERFFFGVDNKESYVELAKERIKSLIQNNF